MLSNLRGTSPGLLAIFSVSTILGNCFDRFTKFSSKYAPAA